MNILSFDVEDWYNCDFLSKNIDWNRYEIRINDGIKKILNCLEEYNLKGTFFCLGWLADNNPEIIKLIKIKGHDIGCHSYSHRLLYNMDKSEFYKDTVKAKEAIEKIVGEEITKYRAPGFSIGKNNIWALDVLIDIGFKIDCSILPAEHDYGGMIDYPYNCPSVIYLENGKNIKEFPMSVIKIGKNNIIFSGGGYFRAMPYVIIKKLMESQKYVMTYFHSRDFDPKQPILKNLPIKRIVKSYIGLNYSFNKFQKLLNDYSFNNIKEADITIDWEKVPYIKL